MKVWIVGSAGYDFSKNEYVCLSYEAAVKRWNEVRDILIKKHEDMIEYEKREGYTNYGGWEKYIVMLRNLKPGESCQCDHPYIEVFEADFEADQ